jgi:hypothetical protein
MNKKTSKVTVKKLKEYFSKHHGHINHELSDKELKAFINQYYKTEKNIFFRCDSLSLFRIADQLSDYLLSQGLCNVQE